jgi:5'-3' exonuclease
METTAEIVLIDLSSIAYPIYLTTQSDPDPNKASQQIVARVRDLVNSHPHAAVCCDSGRSFRHDLDTSYKANRPEKDAPLHHQMTLACEQLKADGFPVWSVRGFEADDLIASATAKALSLPDLTVLIVSADKDLLQLVGPRVRAKSARDGSIVDADAVVAKFGVKPEQMRDYLTLVGDSSDNVKGATGIGPKKAAQLLATFGTLDACYEAIAKKEAALPASIVNSLTDFYPRLQSTRALIALRTDVDVQFDEIAADRVPKDAETFGMDDSAEEEAMESHEPTTGPAIVTTTAAPAFTATTENQPPASTTTLAPASESSTALVVRDGEVIAPAEYERQLDPRSMKDAITLAKHMYESRMFSSYGTPQGVLATVMVGRELGLPAMASLRSIHNIEGKHGLAASLMVALVLKSGLAEYFEPVSFTDTEATFETKRKGARKAVTLTHTIEMARQAWPKTKQDWEKSFLASGWGRNPTDMLVARATSRLARMVYPDLLAGLYTPEELAEIREQVAA